LAITIKYFKEQMKMKNKDSIRGQKGLVEKVIEAGLCMNCGACANLCPYIASRSCTEKAVIIHPCDREEGICYAFCPRIPADMTSLRKDLFDPGDLTPELGSVKGFYMTRATDQQVRNRAQHGGTVTTFVSLALEEGLIDTAVLAEGEAGVLPRGAKVSDPSEVGARAKSKLIVTPIVAEFNRIAGSGAEKIGVVTTPCQALAFAKMRQKPFPLKDNHIDKLHLTIGLFCGWAFSWRKLTDLLREKIGEDSITGLDIPPSGYQIMEVRTPAQTLEIPIDDVLTCVREACRYCFDMTAEFSDISVGAGRCPEGWETARSWNQVITRTSRGEELIDLARSRGLLEFREVPEGNLERLKEASLNKKRVAAKNLADKSGDPGDLIYLDGRDPLWSGILK
jgi:coenzyme F420 hydrogenase subunit beta